MTSNGIYDIVFGTWQALGSATVLVKDGGFSGETDRGTRVEGVCRTDPDTTRNFFDMSVAIPPGVETVTGITGGDAGRTMRISGELPNSGGERRFSVSLGGRAVDIVVLYRGPLPPDPEAQ